MTNDLVNSKNIHYSGITKLDQAEEWDIHHAKQSTGFCFSLREFFSPVLDFSQSPPTAPRSPRMPILTNGCCVWSINHLYHHAVFTDCKRQDKMFVIVGLIVCWDRQNLFIIG